MKMRPLAALTAVDASVSAIACGTSEEADVDESRAAISTRNLGRADFGLKDWELILTLDDGPGVRTKDLVNHLVQEQVPAVFFMVGKNAKADPASVEYVATHSKDVPGGLIIANRSNTHTTPLPKQGVDGTVNRLQYETDRNDVSTVSIVLETGTGNIVTGKRHAFQNEAGVVNARRPNVQIDELPPLADGRPDPRAIDCTKGSWRGVFKYADGATETFRFSKPGQ